MSIAKRCACLFFLLTFVLCHSALDDRSSQEVAFTPPVCLHGRSVDPAQLPASCSQTWFVLSGGENHTSHATSSASSRATIRFTATGIGWFSPHVARTCGSADVFLDDTRIDRVQLSPNNTGAGTPTWSTTGLDPYIVHNLTIAPLGDDTISIDFFELIQYQNALSPVVAAANLGRGPAQKDGSSGALISIASIGAVALLVAICGVCFFLGKRRKSPGFHMPTVLVASEHGLDNYDPPSPTTVRAWREPSHKSAAAGEPTRDQYPPNCASGPRPPSYRSTQDSLYRSDLSQSHPGHRQ